MNPFGAFIEYPGFFVMILGLTFLAYVLMRVYHYKKLSKVLTEEKK